MWLCFTIRSTQPGGVSEGRDWQPRHWVLCPLVGLGVSQQESWVVWTRASLETECSGWQWCQDRERAGHPLYSWTFSLSLRLNKRKVQAHKCVRRDQRSVQLWLWPHDHYSVLYDDAVKNVIIISTATKASTFLKPCRSTRDEGRRDGNLLSNSSKWHHCTTRNELN